VRTADSFTRKAIAGRIAGLFPEGTGILRDTGRTA
jgi:hypothetical protein